MGTDPLWGIKTRFRIRAKLRRILPILDVLTAIPTFFAGAYFLTMKRLGLNEMKLNKAALDRLGVWPIRRHYYEPYFDEKMLRQALDEPRDLPGLELNTEFSLAILASVANYGHEPLSSESDPEPRFKPGNGTYGLPDAALLYGLIRHLKPRNVIEVGSGNSTLVVMKSLFQNQKEGHNCEHLCIEPFEMPWLESTGAKVHRAMIEDVDPLIFDKLEQDDILFIDNSHMIRPQGDVVTVVQKILPRLKPGVFVHIHDLFTPRDYPADWLIRDRTLWNEQYLVEAFLTWNDRFETVIAANHIYVDHRAAFDRIRPELSGPVSHVPSAYWLRRRPAEARSA